MRVENDNYLFVVSSNDHNSNDDDEQDDNSIRNDDIQECNERYSFHLSFIFVA